MNLATIGERLASLMFISKPASSRALELHEPDPACSKSLRTSYSKDSDLNDDASIHHTILAFDPGRMLAFRTIKPPKNFPYPAITNTWTVVYFESAGAGKTRVTIHMMGFEDDDQGSKMREFFERGNQSEFDALAKYFDTGATQIVR